MTPLKFADQGSGLSGTKVSPSQLLHNMLEIKHILIDIYRELPNSTNKFRGVIVNNLEATNHHKTWGRKPRSVGVICKNNYEEWDVEWNENRQ
ncbi:hypothetical protein TNCV_1549171 [Trichonephila clavipes]|nr:hypothetical protein TNCV_1549171 [Trichonephila clavipes]